jgi:phage terminase large subunit-like protein
VGNAALDLLFGPRLEDGRCWGDAAVACQVADAEAVLDPGSGTPYNFETRSRGYAKTSDQAGVQTTVMLAQAPPGSRLYAVAADLDQGRLIVEAIDGFARRTPELRGALDVNAYRVTVTRTGTTLEVLPADGPSAWGLRPWFVTVDEFAQWPDTRGARTVWEAVTSAVAKVHGCRLVVLTTAGDPAHWSRRVLDHALTDPLWRVHEVAGPAPWLDPRKVEEQRRRLPDSVYRRLFLNEWVSGEDRLVSAEDLAACVVLDGPQARLPGMAYVAGVDVGLKNDRTAVAVCHIAHGTVTLDRLAVWSGTRLQPVRLTDVEEYLAKVARDYRAQIVVDPWQSAQLTERLRRRNVRVREFPFTAQSVGRIASTLYLLLRERNLRLPDDPELLDELANVRLRETSPGVLRMDHDSGRHDDRAIALALAAHRLVEKGETRSPATVHVPRGRIGDPARRPARRTRVPTLAADRPATLEEQLFAAGIAAHDNHELTSYLGGGR